MSIRGDILEHAFHGQQDPFAHCLKRSSTAVSPDTVVTAPKGTLLIMDYNGNAVDKDCYINTDGVTAWTLIHNETA